LSKCFDDEMGHSKFNPIVIIFQQSFHFLCPNRHSDLYYSFVRVLPAGYHDLFPVRYILAPWKHNTQRYVSTDCEEEVKKKLLLVEKGEKNAGNDECDSK
jgi:hypothetical protein